MSSFTVQTKVQVMTRKEVGKHSEGGPVLKGEQLHVTVHGIPKALELQEGESRTTCFSARQRIE